jgi:hypothetical protein
MSDEIARLREDAFNAGMTRAITSALPINNTESGVKQRVIAARQYQHGFAQTAPLRIKKK